MKSKSCFSIEMPKRSSAFHSPSVSVSGASIPIPNPKTHHRTTGKQ
jgi:hypothetical protein